MTDFEIYKYEEDEDRRVWRVYTGIDNGLTSPKQMFEYGLHTPDGHGGIEVTVVTTLPGTETMYKMELSDGNYTEVNKQTFDDYPDIRDIINFTNFDQPTNKFKTAIKNNWITEREKDIAHRVMAKSMSRFYKDNTKDNTITEHEETINELKKIINDLEGEITHLNDTKDNTITEQEEKINELTELINGLEGESDEYLDKCNKEKEAAVKANRDLLRINENLIRKLPTITSPNHIDDSDEEDGSLLFEVG